MPAVPSLYVIKGRDQGTLFDVDQGVTAVGRDASNEIRLHDTEVSRRHAELRIEAGACTIVW